MWRLLKVSVFLFLLLWFLFHQNLIAVQVKPIWKEKIERVKTIDRQPEAPRAHIVRDGETLSAIAAQTGVNSKLLMSLNRLDNPNRIYAGQHLVLPAQSLGKPSPSD